MIFGELRISTSSRSQSLDITEQVESRVRESGIDQGFCVIYVPHTTAGVMVNEGADAAVVRDISAKLEEIVPWEGDYHHSEGNSAAHIKSCLLGHSATILIRGGRLLLGTWQSIFFCEFDGPRSRKVEIGIVEG